MLYYLNKNDRITSWTKKWSLFFFPIVQKFVKDVEPWFFTIGIVTLALGLQPICNLKRETNQKSIVELYHNFTSVGECKGVNPNNPELIPT
jgi:hypothetical protein